MSVDFNAAEGGSGGPTRLVLNILSLFFLAMTCLCPVITLIILAVPGAGLNLAAASVPTTVFVLPTESPTPLYEFPPTWTPTTTLEPSPTETVKPTLGSGTLMATISPVGTTPAPGSVVFPFAKDSDSPTYSASLKGCNWLGVGGYVYDITLAPINNLYVLLGGTISGNTLDSTTISGTADGYGPGGFEFQLANKPILNLNSLWVQLLDGSKHPISDKVFFNTYEGCDRNLVTVNFVQQP